MSCPPLANDAEGNSSDDKTTDESTEDLVVEVDVSVYQFDRPKKKKKENCAQYINWKRYMKKVFRNSGEAYLNYKGKPVAAKQIISPLCTCKKECDSQLTKSEKENILLEFYKMGNKDLQDDYLNTLLIIKPVKKRRKIEPDRQQNKKLRTFSCFYMIKTETKEFPVCKTAFCNLFVVDKSRIDIIAQKLANERPELLMDQPRKMRTFRNKLSEEVLNKVMEHIRTFPYKYPILEDQVTRDLHVKTMYMMYLQENHPISYDLLSKGMQAFPEIPFECYYKCASNYYYGFQITKNIDYDDDFDVIRNSGESTNVIEQ